MKDDLRRLMDEFLMKTRPDRTKIIETQYTKEGPVITTETVREPTLMDFIHWLNEDPHDL